MAGSRILHLFAGLLGLASGSKFFSKAPNRRIIICNAYASNEPLDIVNTRSQLRLTNDAPLSYKSCQEFSTLLEEGDRLEFKVGNVSIGIFRATGIPKGKVSLLLVPHRRESSSLTAAFESHAFAETETPQIAVVDAYRGKEVGRIKIMDDETLSTDKQEQRQEELRFNSVVALGTGNYQVLLETDEIQDVTKVPLRVTMEQANYVVLRTGLQSAANTTAGVAFPQELVVYGEPQRSLAAAVRLSAFVAALAGLAASLL
mmetsp:Transcript_57969/g.172431  ORF Transcript_57969/g.172431 Transcript_57969/m.172431 type:complete len:259 (+) Transcript_57969:71-847(+)